VSEIMDEFLAMSEEGRAQLLLAIGDGDLTKVERAAHTLKGVSANVGACALADVCADMETEARQAKADGTARLVARFESEYARMRDALRALRRGRGADLG
jgi:HPt (histidine-containing phosphotransfer) domain-containing protein